MTRAVPYIAVELPCPICNTKPTVLSCDGCGREASVVLCPHRATRVPIRTVSMYGSEYTTEMSCYECDTASEDLDA